MIYRIDLIGEYDKNLIGKIQRDSIEQVDGIYELYDGLYVSGFCESYSRSRIHYVAYTLANNNIKFEYDEV